MNYIDNVNNHQILINSKLISDVFFFPFNSMLQWLTCNVCEYKEAGEKFCRRNKLVQVLFSSVLEVIYIFDNILLNISTSNKLKGSLIRSL